MAQDHGLCREKEKGVKWTRRTGRHCRPVLQLPTGQSVAGKLLALTDNKPPALLNGDPGAHGMKQGKAQRSN